jgi:hypothetical protein
VNQWATSYLQITIPGCISGWEGEKYRNNGNPLVRQEKEVYKNIDADRYITIRQGKVE